MSVKLGSSLPPQVLRPEPQSPVSPGFAKGEPVPAARPGASTDGFERLSPGAPPPELAGSRFEGAGALERLPPRLEQYRTLTENLVNLFTQDDKLRELANSDPPQAKKIFEGALLSAGVPKGAASVLAGRGIEQVRAFRPVGSSIPVDPCHLSAQTRGEVDVEIGRLGPDIKSVADAIKAREHILSTVKLREGDTPEALDAYTSLELGKLLVKQGIDFGRVGPGRDGFHVGAQVGLAPGEHLEDLPAKLEPHREALEKLTDRLLRDPKLDNNATLRKALWTELKKLPFQEDDSRHEARQYLLEDFSLRQDRYTE